MFFGPPCISIISSISLFEIDKKNFFPASTSLCPVIFLSSLYIIFEVAFEAICLNNRDKTSLVKGAASFVIVSLSNVSPKLANPLSEVPEIHLIELLETLSFTMFYIFLVKTFPILISSFVAIHLKSFS